MSNTKYYIPLLAFLLSFSACKKYVDIEPKGKVVPSEVRDYRLLMNNSNNLLRTIGVNEYGTDDISFAVDPTYKDRVGTLVSNLYTFNSMIYNQEEDDDEWNALYEQIYVANVCIKGIPQAIASAGVDANQVLGEAFVLRASNYYYLVNNYAKVYDLTTATSDEGVPLVLEPDLNAVLKRASVQAVYDQIIQDLNTAVDLLGTTPTNKFYASKSAAHAYLARTYLMMGNYEAANKEALLVLESTSTIEDFNSYVSVEDATVSLLSDSVPMNKDNSEIIHWRDASNPYGLFILSDELIALFEDGDLRKDVLMASATDLLGLPGTIFNGEYYYNAAKGTANYMTRNAGPTVPEMMLIQAEYLARSGDGAGALSILNKLRAKRFLKGTYTQMTDLSNPLSTVLEERRRELFMRGARWFDLRRLNKESALAKTIVHKWGDGSSFELPAASSKYVLPIPPKVIMLSNEITQNPR